MRSRAPCTAHGKELRQQPQVTVTAQHLGQARGICHLGTEQLQGKEKQGDCGQLTHCRNGARGTNSPPAPAHDVLPSRKSKGCLHSHAALSSSGTWVWSKTLLALGLEQSRCWRKGTESRQKQQ